MRYPLRSFLPINTGYNISVRLPITISTCFNSFAIFIFISITGLIYIFPSSNILASLIMSGCLVTNSEFLSIYSCASLKVWKF